MTAVPADYSVHVFKEDDGYIAVSPEWPGLSAFGSTQQLAINEMQAALELAIEMALEDGEMLPEPAHAEPASPYSGRILLRLPRTLHGAIARQAKRDDTSMNTLVIQLLSYALGSLRDNSTVDERDAAEWKAIPEQAGR